MSVSLSNKQQSVVSRVRSSNRGGGPRRRGIALLTALAVAAMGLVPTGAALGAPGEDATYVPVPNVRVLDTRDATGDVQGAIGAQQAMSTAVAGVGGVPADARAVAVNVTSVSPTAMSYLTVWPSGSAMPPTSTLNVQPGVTVANNMVIAEVGTDGEVDIYNNAGEVHVILDVVGYFPGGTDYAPVPAARLLDTRDPGGAPLGAGASMVAQVAGLDGIPADASAVAVNVTSVAPTAASWLTVWPSGSAMPPTSTLNVQPGVLVANNMVIAEIGAGSSVNIFNSTGEVDVILDVVGYFPADTDYSSVPGARLLDTRDGGGPLGAGATMDATVAGLGGIPADASAVAVNVTAVSPTAASWLTLWPTGATMPSTSTLNVQDDVTVTNNMVIAEVGTDGKVSIFNSAGTVHVILDVVGYFVGAPPGPDPAAPKIELSGPDTVTVYEAGDFSVRVSNAGEEALDENAEIKIAVTRTGGIEAGDMTLEYHDGTAWTGLPLAADDGKLTGGLGEEFALLADFDETTQLRATFQTADDYEITASLVGATDSVVYDTSTIGVKAVDVNFTNQTTVRLNWQNQYRADQGTFGGVDDYAAFHLDNVGAGEVTLRWNTAMGLLETDGEVEVTGRAVGFGLHVGALDVEGGAAVLALPAPTFVGAAEDEPGDDVFDRGRFTYRLDGRVTGVDPVTLAALDAALAADGLTGWYLNVRTVQNPAGELRGQLGVGVDDGGLYAIVPQFKLFEFHELGDGTITGEDQTSFNLWFEADIAFAGASGQQRPQPEDFVLMRERDGETEELEVIRVRGDNPDWQPYPKEDIRIHLDTHDIIEDEDVVTVTILDSGVEKLRPVGRNSGADDLSESWRTRCTRVLSVPAMTSEPCGTPPQPGLSGFEATPIDSAPHQTQELKVTIEAPGIPPHPEGLHDNFDGEPWELYEGEPWELWIDLDEVSHDGLVDYSESTWAATIDGEPVGRVEFWEYREVERFAIEWEPFLVFTHDEAEPVSGELVLTGTGIDGSDAAVHGETTEYDTFVVRYDTGRPDYTEIVVNHVPQPTITLEPADAVVLAETNARLTVEATYTDIDGNPVPDASIRFWAEQGERPDIVVKDLGTVTTSGGGLASVTYYANGRDVDLGDPLIDTLRAQLVDEDDPDARFVDAETTVTWATGAARNDGPSDAAGTTYHDLNEAVADADEGDTITAKGEFTSVRNLPRSDRVQVRKADLTLRADAGGASLLGAFDVRADGATVEGFHVEQAGTMEYAFRVEGAGITISNNTVDADGADGFRVRDAWGPVGGGGSAEISGNEISNAAIAIDVDNRDQATALVTDVAITDNQLVNNVVAIHYNPAGGIRAITGNHFVAGDAGEVYVRDATEGEALDLTAILAGNTYDPAGEILGRRIAPADPTAQPYIVRIVNHVRGGEGSQYTDIEYSRPVVCDGGPETGSQFTLSRGPANQQDRTGVSVTCYGTMVRVHWNGNPNLPNHIEYLEHEEAEFRIRRADVPDPVYAVSPQMIDHQGRWPTLPGEDPTTMSLEPQDHVLHAGVEPAHSVTATAECPISGNPKDGDVTFTVTRGGVVVAAGTIPTEEGSATFTYQLANPGLVVPGHPIVDEIHAVMENDSATTTAAWAAGVATNERSDKRFHDLNDAVAGAQPDDPIVAVGAFTADRVLIDRSLHLRGEDAQLVGAFDLRSDDVTVEGFVIEHTGTLPYVMRVDGSGITISGNRFVLTGDPAGRVYVDDVAGTLDLDGILEANEFVPPAEVSGHQIVPKSEDGPHMVSLTHFTGGRDGPRTVIRYSAAVTWDGDTSAVVASQFTLDRGKANQANRTGADILGKGSDTITIHWDGNANQPNHVEYVAHTDAQHWLTGLDWTPARSPDVLAIG
jgi:hypothetical protein